MADKLKQILEKQLVRIKIKEEEYERLRKLTNEIAGKIIKEIKQKKIKAEIFLGGSLAKGTIIKKDKYDIDIYARFEKEEDTKKLELIIKLVGRARKIHGSRDYFQIEKNKIMFEVIPVLKIKKPEEAENVTDLSWFHVKYVTDEIKKNPKLRDEIILAKSFAYACECYGAESYIQGFSGYALELLIIYYGSFVRFLRAVAEKEQIVIASRFYKNRQEVLMNMNEAKLSPIVYVDPTFKERNVLAALSKETLEKFKTQAKGFLKHPGLAYFERKKIDEKKFKIKLEINTDRQEGDIAGTKLKKFYKLLMGEIGAYFKIKDKEFVYDGKKKARLFFNLDKKKEIIVRGPPVIKIGNVAGFKKKHKKLILKNGFVFAREKAVSFPVFFSDFKRKNKKKMRDMGILNLKVC